VLSIYQEEITKLRDDEWDDDSKEILEEYRSYQHSTQNDQDQGSTETSTVG
jgi:cell fate (sporulation/competence/biofilm development) regulator YlbF (YheA/YmcA/DUF963 family)